MTHDILTASGIPYRQGRFLHPPAETYGIIFDNLDASGPDPLPGVPQIVRHDVMVELYEPKPDPDAEAALEAELRARGLHWTKEDRYWLQDAQRYQVVYEFNYIEKVRA